jgi:hypothetical protein
MEAIKIMILTVPLFLLFSCSREGDTSPVEPQSTPIPREKPADFQLTYAWEVGSLPPPYFYEYTITLGPAAEGVIRFGAGYPGADRAEWEETFALGAADLMLLFEALTAAGAFTDAWRQREDIPVGGSAGRLSITADGVQYKIPSFIADEEQARAMDEIYARIDRLVPAALWEILYARQAQYELAHEGED